MQNQFWVLVKVMGLFGIQVSLSLLTSPEQLQSNKLITRHFEKINLAAVAPKISHLLQSVPFGRKGNIFYWTTYLSLSVSPLKCKLIIRSLRNAGPLQSCEAEFIGAKKKVAKNEMWRQDINDLLVDVIKTEIYSEYNGLGVVYWDKK